MFWPRRRWGRWRHRYCPILPARRACLPRGSPRREAVTASISAGSSLRGTQPARRCRALRTPAGAMWTCRMTGASRGRLIRTRRAAGRHHTCPRGSGGIGRSFACLPRTGTELRCWSSTACIRTAKFGSTASIWVCAPQNAPSSGSAPYLPTGLGWYRKKFRVPAEDRDRVAVLEFDGVYQNSEVWINGQYLGMRPSERAEQRVGTIPAHGARVVSEEVSRACRGPGPSCGAGVRRRVSEQRSLDQRPVSGYAPLRTRRAAGRAHTCPRGSGGIGRSFACLPRTGTELRCWSSTACIRTAKFGSTASIWVCAPQNAPSSGSGAYLPTGIGWYRKKFRVPAEDRDRVAVLEFDGVY